MIESGNKSIYSRYLIESLRYRRQRSNHWCAQRFVTCRTPEMLPTLWYVLRHCSDSVHTSQALECFCMCMIGPNKSKHACKSCKADHKDMESISDRSSIKPCRLNRSDERVSLKALWQIHLLANSQSVWIHLLAATEELHNTLRWSFPDISFFGKAKALASARAGHESLSSRDILFSIIPRVLIVDVNLTEKLSLYQAWWILCSSRVDLIEDPVSFTSRRDRTDDSIIFDHYQKARRSAVSIQSFGGAIPPSSAGASLTSINTLTNDHLPTVLKLFLTPFTIFASW